MGLSYLSSNDKIDFSKFSLGDLIWIANQSVCEYNRMNAFKAMLKHPNRSVKYVYDTYRNTKDSKLKEFARTELKKDENFLMLSIIGIPKDEMEEIKK